MSMPAAPLKVDTASSPAAEAVCSTMLATVLNRLNSGVRNVGRCMLLSRESKVRVPALKASARSIRGGRMALVASCAGRVTQGGFGVP